MRWKLGGVNVKVLAASYGIAEIEPGKLPVKVLHQIGWRGLPTESLALVDKYYGKMERFCQDDAIALWMELVAFP